MKNPYRTILLNMIAVIFVITGGMPLPAEAMPENVDRQDAGVAWSSKEPIQTKHFGQKSPKPPVDPVLAKKIEKVSALQGKSVTVETPVHFYGNPASPQQDTDLKPRRTTFPGKSHTMSQIDEENPSQLNVLYKIDDTATAHVAVNEQDIDSPTYAPIKKEEGLNAAGVYLNLDVKENVQMKVGGEVRSHETISHNDEVRSSAGARVGLQWSF